MAAPEFLASVDAGVNQGNASVSIPAPDGVAAGDYQLVVLAMVSTGVNVGATPPGWTLLDNQTGTYASGETLRVALYESTSDTGAFTMTLTAGRVWHAIRAAYELPEESSGRTAAASLVLTDSASTSQPLPPVTTTEPDSRIIGFGVSERISGEQAWSTGAMIERHETTALNTVERLWLVLGDVVREEPGPGSPDTFTTTAAERTYVGAVVLDGVGETVAVTGELAGTLAAPTAASSATITTPGTVATSLAMPTAESSATVTTSGSVAASLAPPTAAVTGTVTGSGAVSTSLPLPGAALAGDVTGGGLAGVLQVPTASIAAQTSTEGALSGSLPLPVAALGADGGVAGELAASLPLPGAAVAGSVAAPAAVAASLPLPGAELVAIVSEPLEDVFGELAASLSLPVAELVGAVTGGVPVFFGKPFAGEPRKVEKIVAGAPVGNYYRKRGVRDW